MKSLQEQLNESLVNESRPVLPVSAYSLGELIDFVADFNPNTKNEEDWVGFDDYSVDWDVLKDNKSFAREFCKACKTIKQKAKYGSRFLGNYPYDDFQAKQELLRDELGAETGDEVNILTCDGDDGQFFYIYSSDKRDVQKAIDTLISSTTGRGGWDWIQATIEEPEEE